MISIIGGAGFLGSRLQRRLFAAGVPHKVLDIVNERNIENYHRINVEDLESLDSVSGSDCIVNLAAVHHDNVYPVSRYDDVNIQGAKNVCEAANTYGINKIIFLSSVAIYGFAPPQTGEDGAIDYFNDYGRTKYLAEQVYKQWCNDDKENRTLVIIRPTVIFGEDNRGNVFNLLQQIATKRFVMFGNGENIKSMAYVENVAAFIEYSLGFDRGLHIYNYVDKPDLTMNALVAITRETLFDSKGVGLRLPAILGIAIGYFFDLVARLIGRSLPVSSLRVKKFLTTTQFTSAAKETGFLPPVSLEEALRATLEFEFKGIKSTDSLT